MFIEGFIKAERKWSEEINWRNSFICLNHKGKCRDFIKIMSWQQIVLVENAFFISQKIASLPISQNTKSRGLEAHNGLPLGVEYTQKCHGNRQTFGCHAIVYAVILFT